MKNKLINNNNSHNKYNLKVYLKLKKFQSKDKIQIIQKNRSII